ncbi:hypothetical protein BDW69DRAFT_179908 [Aspergillus filifer]
MSTTSRDVVFGDLEFREGSTSVLGVDLVIVGIDKDCYKYHKVISGDQCGTIEFEYGITHSDFTDWNPAIDDKCSSIWLNYYLCVNVSPKSQMADITPVCKEYHKVQSGEGCYAIDTANSFTLDQFREWGPTIDASCTNLWVDCYVCVGV